MWRQGAEDASRAPRSIRTLWSVGFSSCRRGKTISMVDAPAAVGGAVVSKARDWKEPIGRLGLVGQGVVATIVGLLAIRIAIGRQG